MTMIWLYVFTLFYLTDVSPSKVPEKNLQKLQAGLSSLDPIFVKKLDLGKYSLQGEPSLHQVYNNMKIFGLSNSTLIDENTTGEKCHWRFKYTTPLIKVESDYIMKGHLLIIPIDGQGNCTIYLYDVKGEIDAKCQRYFKNGKTHEIVTDFHLDIKPKRVIFDYPNLVSGHENLSKGMNATLNFNPEIVLVPLRSGLSEVVGTAWKKSLH